MEKILWSIALPGLGQFLNGKYLKGTIFIFLEFLINLQANLNKIILLSFQGRIEEAIQQTNYGWLMFYPCLYFLALWDAYKDAGGAERPYSFLPFVFSAYWVTVGLMFSSKLTFLGILFGPVWLPMLFVIPGIASGFLIRLILLKYVTLKNLS